jgi:hypothetical protein
MVTLLFYIVEVLASDLSWDTWLSWLQFCCGCLQSLQASVRVVSQLDHDCLLPNSFPFMIHVLSYHFKLYLATDIVVKYPPEENRIMRSPCCVCLYLCDPLQLLNQWTDYFQFCMNVIPLEPPQFQTLNFLQSITITWRLHKFMRWGATRSWNEVW